MKGTVASNPLRRRGLPIAAVIAVAVLALLAAACSGSGSPNAEGSSSPPSAVAYSRCMRSHRVPNFPDPNSSGQLPKTDAGQLGVSTSQYQAAQLACAHLIPATGSTEEQQQDTQCAMAGDCSQAVVQPWLSGLRTLARVPALPRGSQLARPIITSGGLPHFPYSEAGIDHHSSQILAKVQVCIRLTGFKGIPLPSELSPS